MILDQVVADIHKSKLKEMRKLSFTIRFGTSSRSFDTTSARCASASASAHVSVSVDADDSAGADVSASARAGDGECASASILDRDSEC